MKSLSKIEKEELIDELSKKKAGQYHEINFTNKKLKNILNFYFPLTGEKEREIWNHGSSKIDKNSEEIISIPDDEKVEDAGFSDVELNLFQNKENKTQPNTFA